MADELAAIVTAAGASTRMGTHKALLPWRGEPLVAHQVRRLGEAGFGTVVVVTGAEGTAVGEAVPKEARVVRNDDWPSGRSASIAAGAEAVPDAAKAVLVVAVDQPLSPPVLEALLDHAGAPLVQPVDDAGPGHPVLLGGGQLEALRHVEREPEGLRSLVRGLRDDGTLVRVAGPPHRDLNTPASYLAARPEARGAPSPRDASGRLRSPPAASHLVGGT